MSAKLLRELSEKIDQVSQRQETMNKQFEKHVGGALGQVRRIIVSSTPRLAPKIHGSAAQLQSVNFSSTKSLIEYLKLNASATVREHAMFNDILNRIRNDVSFYEELRKKRKGDIVPFISSLILDKMNEDYALVMKKRNDLKKSRKNINDALNNQKISKTRRTALERESIQIKKEIDAFDEQHANLAKGIQVLSLEKVDDKSVDAIPPSDLSEQEIKDSSNSLVKSLNDLREKIHPDIRNELWPSIRRKRWELSKITDPAKYNVKLTQINDLIKDVSTRQDKLSHHFDQEDLEVWDNVVISARKALSDALFPQANNYGDSVGKIDVQSDDEHDEENDDEENIGQFTWDDDDIPQSTWTDDEEEPETKLESSVVTPASSTGNVSRAIDFSTPTIAPTVKKTRKTETRRKAAEKKKKAVTPSTALKARAARVAHQMPSARKSYTQKASPVIANEDAEDSDDEIDDAPVESDAEDAEDNEDDTLVGSGSKYLKKKAVKKAPIADRARLGKGPANKSRAKSIKKTGTKKL